MSVAIQEKRKSGYRRKYERYLGVAIPKDFDVHHIDCNPLNDDIGNLVAIPNYLHKDYHWFIGNRQCFYPDTSQRTKNKILKIKDEHQRHNLLSLFYQSIEYKSILSNYNSCIMLCKKIQNKKVGNIFPHYSS